MITYKSYNQSEFKDCFIVVDENVSKIYNIVGKNVFVLPSNEQAKSFNYLEKICDFLLVNLADRNDTVVGIGGGVTCDITAFVASVYKRGINLVLVPTTLLSIIDASIGGKTAINLNNVKNVVGSFYKGDTVIDFNYLNTLNDDEIYQGVGEMLKYSLLDKKIDEIFDICYKNRDFLDKNLIKECIDFKTKICDKDFFDKGERNILNIGHTFAHAFEMENNLSHGIAVLNGLYYELLLAEKFTDIDKKYLEKKLTQIRNLTNVIGLDVEKTVKITLSDKKNDDGKICFILVCDDYKTQKVFLTKEILTQTLLNL